MDMLHHHRFPPPCVIIKKFAVDAESLFENLLVSISDVFHGVKSKIVQSSFDAGSDLTEVSQRKMIPESFPIGFFGQAPYSFLVVFGDDIHRYLGKIEICSYAYGSTTRP